MLDKSRLAVEIYISIRECLSKRYRGEGDTGEDVVVVRFLEIFKNRACLSSFDLTLII